MIDLYIIGIMAFGVALGALIAFAISNKEKKNLVIYNEEGIPRILDLSDPYIRIAYVAIGIAGPKNWEPRLVRKLAFEIAEVLRKYDKNFQIRDNIQTEPQEEEKLGLCPDCGEPIYKTTTLVAGESVPILKCRSCDWESWDPPIKGDSEE